MRPRNQCDKCSVQSVPRLRYGKLLLCILVIAGVLLAPRARAFAGQGEVVERVMAIVNGDLIMLSDVRAAVALGLVQPKPGTDAMRETLSRLIDRALMLDEVERYAPPEPTQDAVAAEIARIRARFPTGAALEQTLAGVGMDSRQLQEMVREDLRIRAYVTQRFTADTAEHTQAAVDQWLSTLRRRADIDRYEP